jgi:hypothetical protein
MFTGDGTNWTVDSSMLEEDYLIPLPLGLLYPRGNIDFIDYWYFEGVVHSANYFLDTTIVNHTNPKFENTIIATEEFADRHFSLKMMMNYMSLLNQEDYFLDEVDDKNRPWNYDIWKIYYENLDQSLYVLDSMAEQHYTEYFYENKAKLIAFTKKINSHWKDYHDYRGREYVHDYFDFSNQTIDEWFLSPLTFYPISNRNELKLIKDYGVDLNAADADKQLRAQNISPVEIKDILTYHFKRQALIKKLQKEKDRIDGEKAVSTLYETTVFSVKKLGWINCDRFYQDPKADKAEILLTNSSDRSLNFIDFSLVIPDLNARVMSFQRTSDLYSFTREAGPYTKLPIGKDAIIIGLAEQNDSIFFASQNIKIKDGLRLDLNMEYIVEEALKDSLWLVLK